jgi:hypothetical protein
MLTLTPTQLKKKHQKLVSPALMSGLMVQFNVELHTADLSAAVDVIRGMLRCREVER